MEKNRSVGHFAALITILIWGTTFISTKILLVDFEPIEILVFRFMMGFLALMVACPRRLKGTIKKQEVTFAAAGLCGICLYYLLENIALTYTLASNVGVIISVSPFFTAILTHLFMKNEDHLRANVKALLRRHLVYDNVKEETAQEKYAEWIEAKNIRIHTKNSRNCIITRSFLFVIILKTSSAKGILSRNRHRMKSSSIGRRPLNCCKNHFLSGLQQNALPQCFQSFISVSLSASIKEKHICIITISE
jgi:uncharacterized membrane protein